MAPVETEMTPHIRRNRDPVETVETEVAPVETVEAEILPVEKDPEWNPWNRCQRKMMNCILPSTDSHVESTRKQDNMRDQR